VEGAGEEAAPPEEGDSIERIMRKFDEQGQEVAGPDPEEHQPSTKKVNCIVFLSMKSNPQRLLVEAYKTLDR